MRPFKGWTCGLGWLPTLTLALGACQQAETGTGSGRPTAPDSSIDFATDPSILRGKWTGVGVSDSYGEIVFSSDGALFAACTQQGLTVWEVATDAERFRGTCAQPLSMGFSPDASLLVLRDPRTIRVLSGESGVVLASAEAKTLPYRTTNAPVFSPDGSLFITDEAFETDVGEDSRLRFWQLNKEADEKVVLAPGARVGAGGGATDAAFSSDGRYVVVAEDGDVGLWRVGDGTLVRRYRNDDGAYSVAFGSYDSVYIGGENAIRRVSLTGDALGSFQTGDSYAEPVLSPDGRYLLSNSSSRNLQIWDTGSGERVKTLEAEPPTDPNYGYRYTLAFDDEQGIYVASGYGEVTRYNLSSDSSKSLLRAEPFTLALELTATYVDRASYDVAGTFAFGDGASSPVDGNVCVSEGLKTAGQALEAMTSPTTCGTYLSVGNDQQPTWTISGWTPSGSPPASALSVMRGEEHYRFWLTRQGDD